MLAGPVDDNIEFMKFFISLFALRFYLQDETARHAITFQEKKNGEREWFNWTIEILYFMDAFSQSILFDI